MTVTALFKVSCNLLLHAHIKVTCILLVLAFPFQVTCLLPDYKHPSLTCPLSSCMYRPVTYCLLNSFFLSHTPFQVACTVLVKYILNFKLHVPSCHILPFKLHAPPCYLPPVRLHAPFSLLDLNTMLHDMRYHLQVTSANFRLPNYRVAWY